MEPILQSFWSKDTKSCISDLQTNTTGLSSDEAKKRLTLYGANRLKPKKKSDAVTLLIKQFKSPIILILIFATGLSLFLHNFVDASIIIAIVFISGLLCFGENDF